MCQVAHGSEPAFTWPSGIIAPLMDEGDPHCADYIYVWQAAGYELQVTGGQSGGPIASIWLGSMLVTQLQDLRLSSVQPTLCCLLASATSVVSKLSIGLMTAHRLCLLCRCWLRC